MRPARPSPTQVPPLTCAFAADLGITNAQLAVCSAGSSSLVRDTAGATSLPMVAAYADGKLLIGNAAKRQLLINTACVAGVSRLLGRRFNSAAVNAMQRRLSFRLCAGQRGGVAVALGDRCVDVDEICSALLKKLRETAETYVGEVVNEMLIAVPAYFDPSQREALQSAAEQANLRSTLVEAPRAALRALFPDQFPQGTRQAVVHVGGGSCEVTIVEVGQIAVEKLADSGDAFLGGDVLDRAIAEWLVSTVDASLRIELQRDPICRQRLRDAAEQAKCRAADAGEARIDLPRLLAGDGRELHLQLALRAEQLDELARPLLAGIVEICRSALARARLAPGDVDGVVLVGGQTRLRCVRAAIAAFFGKQPRWEEEPEGTVARGAASEAMLMAEPPEIELALDI